MPRSIQEILDHADELAKRFEDYEPSPGDERPVEEYLLHARCARSCSQRTASHRRHRRRPSYRHLVAEDRRRPRHLRPGRPTTLRPPSSNPPDPQPARTHQRLNRRAASARRSWTLSVEDVVLRFGLHWGSTLYGWQHHHSGPNRSHCSRRRSERGSTDRSLRDRWSCSGFQVSVGTLGSHRCRPPGPGSRPCHLHQARGSGDRNRQGTT